MGASFALSYSRLHSEHPTAVKFKLKDVCRERRIKKEENDRSNVEKLDYIRQSFNWHRVVLSKLINLVYVIGSSHHFDHGYLITKYFSKSVPHWESINITERKRRPIFECISLLGRVKC